MVKPSYLTLPKCAKLAYERLAGSSPGIMYLGGFRSDMTGSKAEAMAQFCRERRIGFIRFDYEGHGQSSGKFEDVTLSRWKDDAMAVLMKLTRGPQILVGSSMGGWLSLLLAMEKPRRVAGVIGIAAAPDFTELMYHEKMNDKQRKELAAKGRIMAPSDEGAPYPVTKALIDDGRKHLLLHYRQLPIYCPVRLLHGMLDEEVPWETSLSLNEKIASQDVKTILVEGGNHRLSTPKDLDRLMSVTGKLLESVRGEKKQKRVVEPY